MASKSLTPKRRNRTVQLGEMISDALDPALRKRGFASRDLIANWQAIAPAPWDKIAMPDKLVWPRRDKPDPEGAVLHLRCLEGHGLALAHEGPAIASAINRYFGYLIVGSVRLSLMPLVPARPAEKPARQLPNDKIASIKTATDAVEDESLRAALEKLGRGVMGKGHR